MPTADVIESFHPLTPRELEVYRLTVNEGWRQVDIAAELGCKVGTIKSHMKSILEKTGAESSLQLTVWHYTKPRGNDAREL